MREERINVRGQPDQLLTVRETRHGPVISDLDSAGADRSWRWRWATCSRRHGGGRAAGAEPSRSVRRPAGGGADQFAGAEPAGRRRADDRPVRHRPRADPQGRRRRAPVPGDGSHDWIGWAGGDALPHSVAPASGRLVNANEPVWPPDFPVFMGRDTFGDWRAQRIRELLDAVHRHTPADFAAMQVDTSDSCSPGRCCRPCWRCRRHRRGRTGAGLLRGWDGARRWTCRSR